MRSVARPLRASGASRATSRRSAHATKSVRMRLLARKRKKAAYKFKWRLRRLNKEQQDAFPDFDRVMDAALARQQPAVMSSSDEDNSDEE